MGAAEDERERLWTAIHVNGDRITDLKAVVETRNEIMRETITEAVKDAMPRALLNDEQHDFVVLLFNQMRERAAFRKRIMESAILWAVPLLILAGLGVLGTVVREYMISHGMWKP